METASKSLKSPPRLAFGHEGDAREAVVSLWFQVSSGFRVSSWFHIVVSFWW